MPASRSTVTGWRSPSAVLERAQLGVDLAERVQLGEHERVVALAEAVQVEDEPAEVAVGELARLAQEARAAARAPARAEAGLLGGGCSRPALGGLAVVRLARRLRVGGDLPESCRIC